MNVAYVKNQGNEMYSFTVDLNRIVAKLESKIDQEVALSKDEMYLKAVKHSLFNCKQDLLSIELLYENRLTIEQLVRLNSGG